MNKKPITWKTITVPLGSLEEWEKNPAKISKEDARELSESLEKFGLVIPYVAAAPPNGKKKIPLADGHQRKSVSLQLLELDPETPVDLRIPDRTLTEKERGELAIRLRKNTGEFDDKKLREFFEKEDLLEWGFDEEELGEMGFEMEEEETKDAEPQVDKAEELLKKWKVKTGDIWGLGDHRLICGDCTDAATVARVMDGEKAGMVFTDPPWNVAIGKDSNPRHRQREGLQNDDMSDEDYSSFV